MRTISTDDAARRQVFSWKGPVDMPFITEMRMPALGAGVVLIPIFAFLGFALTPFVEFLPWPGPAAMGVIARFVIGCLGGALVAVLIIRRVGHHLTPTTPVRHHLETFQSELRTPRPDGEPVTTHLRLDPALWLEDSPMGRVTHHIAAPTFFGEATETHHR